MEFAEFNTANGVTVLIDPRQIVAIKVITIDEEDPESEIYLASGAKFNVAHSTDMIREEIKKVTK